MPNSVDTVDASGVAGALVVELDWSDGADAGTAPDTPDNGGILTFTGAAGGTALTLDDVAVLAGSSIDGGMAGAAVTVDGIVSVSAATLTNVTSFTYTVYSHHPTKHTQHKIVDFVEWMGEILFM